MSILRPTAKPATKPFKLDPPPEPEAPATAAAAKPAERPKPFMSSDRRLEREDPVRTEFRRGPATGAGMTDCNYVAAFANPSELAELRARIEQRRAQPQTYAYERCTNPKCRRTMRVLADAPTNTVCVTCNWGRLRDGGHMKRLDAAATRAFMAEEAAREKTANERAIKAGLHRANGRRAEQGLEPWDMTQYQEALQRERQEQQDRDRQLGEIGQIYRDRARAKK